MLRNIIGDLRQLRYLINSLMHGLQRLNLNRLIPLLTHLLNKLLNIRRQLSERIGRVLRVKVIIKLRQYELFLLIHLMRLLLNHTKSDFLFVY